MESFNVWLATLVESYVFILGLALIAGLLFSSRVIFLAGVSTYLLSAIFFLSALKIDFKQVTRELRDQKAIIVVNVWMLMVLPIIVYTATRFVMPEAALPFLILAAMPAGMTSPLLAEIVGGKQSLALVLTISTSLLAPFTVPLVISLLAGATVTVSFLAMFLALAKVIFIPFAAAQLVRYFWSSRLAPLAKTFKPISIILLGLLITGVVAKQAQTILHGLDGPFVKIIAALFVLFFLFHLLGYATVFWRSHQDRTTIALCVTYLNFTLAIYLADTFFSDPRVVIPVVLSVLPWSLYMVPFRWWARGHLA